MKGFDDDATIWTINSLYSSLPKAGSQDQGVKSTEAIASRNIQKT